MQRIVKFHMEHDQTVRFWNCKIEPGLESEMAVFTKNSKNNEISFFSRAVLYFGENQLCTARTVFSFLVTVRLYVVMQKVCRWLTNEKQRKTDIRLTDQ